MIKTDQEYLEVAMKAYDNPACITIEEFTKDLNQYIHIKKSIRKYYTDKSILRKLVNQIVIYYNCFGKSSTDLLIYKVKEPDVLSVLVPIMLFLGMGNDSLDNLNVDLNIDTIKQLSAEI